MVNYRYLGYGTTNSNGVATLDYDENGDAINGYTGTGIGEVDIVASLDHPITSTSLVSEIYSIQDYLFWDSGLADHRTDWNNQSGDITETYTDNGTKISTGTTAKNYVSSYTMADECVIECDVMKHEDNNSDVRLVAKGYGFYLTTARCPLNTFVHLRGIFSNGKVNWWVDDTKVVTDANQTSSTALQFRVINTGLTFKNFKIYKY